MVAASLVTQSPISQHVSSSIAQATSVAARQWTGLCVASCLALNWPLSMENLAAVKASLLSTFAAQSPAGLSGVLAAPSGAEWSTFAQKVVADLKRDSGRMLVGTRLSWLNFLQSSLTRRIYSTRKTLQRSRIRSFNGQQPTEA